MEKDINEMSTNEIYPKLRFDAFVNNIMAGGLRSVSSIHLLVCYIVSNLNGRVTADIITDAVTKGGLVNYFEIADAISNLIKAGTVLQDDNGILSVTDQTKQMVEFVEKDLPLTVREKSIEICQKIIAKESYKRENTAEIEKIDNGYKVKLKVKDDKNDFLELALYAVSEEQAEMLKDKFISNPVFIYQKLMDAFFDVN